MRQPMPNAIRGRLYQNVSGNTVLLKVSKHGCSSIVPVFECVFELVEKIIITMGLVLKMKKLLYTL